MGKSTFILLILSITILALIKIITTANYASKFKKTNQVETSAELESGEEENTSEEKIYQPKEYISIIDFAFKESQRTIRITCVTSDLFPSHHQIPERPPKKN